MEMIEHVKAAILADAERQSAENELYVEQCGEGKYILDGDFNLEAFARAAVAAMREPTAVMGNAFIGMEEDGLNWQTHPGHHAEFYGNLQGFQESWADAIDAALKTEAK